MSNVVGRSRMDPRTNASKEPMFFVALARASSDRPGFSADAEQPHQGGLVLGEAARVVRLGFGMALMRSRRRLLSP
jgi:hypothetical protein